MADMPTFTALPAPRCCEITNREPLVICNRPAYWMPGIELLQVTPFYCDEHRPTFHRPIAGACRVRRVSVVSQIVLCSALQSDVVAKAEALARLVGGVQRVGGLLNLHTVTGTIGHWTPPAGSGGPNKEGGGP